MGLIGRGVVFTVGTFSNAILFLVLSRVVLPLIATGTAIAGQGPATGAIELIPTAIKLAIGVIEIGLIGYFLGGLGEERTASRRPMP